MNISVNRILFSSCAGIVALAAIGCNKAQPAAAPPGGGMQGMPVKTETVALSPVAQSNEYVATIKSRRSATLQPQVSGRLLRIDVRSGDHIKAGQELMAIDSQPQQATVQAQLATEQQKKALYDYNTIEMERQKKLFDAGVTSRDAFDQAEQAFKNSKADYESSAGLRKTQEEQLAYYTIRAPYDGVVGDIPVHVGDYVSSSTILTTVDENKDLEAYIYIPTEHAAQAKPGLAVDISDTSGKLLEKTRVDFVSPQVDPTLQGILVKAPVHRTPDILRNAQMVKARVIWTTKPTPVVPVLAVTRLGGQTFVFVVKQQNGHAAAVEVPVTLGDTVGNSYAITSGLAAGDKVVVSSTQFLVNGMPVVELGA
ncbi:MAG TPA: efflux RND transporter periplasmic adaptor subunit [Terracidiphilus sp.]|nr:efflux RND transporter periplasmic adaptor subunit [Terracidiphilus sp.]